MYTSCIYFIYTSLNLSLLIMQSLLLTYTRDVSQSIVKTVGSDLRIYMYCYFVLVRPGTIYEFNHETACLIFHGLATLTMKLRFFISNIVTPAHTVYFKSKNELNYSGFIDPNIIIDQKREFCKKNV